MVPLTCFAGTVQGVAVRIYPVCAMGKQWPHLWLVPAAGLFWAGFWAAKGEGQLQKAAGLKGRLRGSWGQCHGAMPE